MERNYIVFARAARNFHEFAMANKRVVRKGLTREEARAFCIHHNDRRTDAEVRRGMKFEFCSAGDL